MTPKQERFCQEFLIDLNATQAAIRAGYSPRTAGKIGSENLQKPEIQDCLTLLRAEAAEKAGLSLEQVIGGLKEIAFDRERADGIRVKALELLGKHLGMFTNTNTANDHDTTAKVTIVMPDNGRGPVPASGHKTSHGP